MIGEYGKFVWLTYLGVVFAIMAMATWLNGFPAQSMMWMIGAGICDLFDGQVARSLPRTPQQVGIGMEIDSLADMVSFAGLPAVIILTAQPNLLFNWLIASLYVLAAISRLAYFNQREKEAPVRTAYFIGLPVAYAALFFPLFYLLTALFAWPFARLLPFLALTLTLLFVAHIRIPKPNRLAYGFYVILAIVTLVGLGYLA